MNYDKINEAAKFYPKEQGNTFPCVEVGGVQVYVYFDEDGVLAVSVHYDGAEQDVLAPDGVVPTRFTASGEDVWVHD